MNFIKTVQSSDLILIVVSSWKLKLISMPHVLLDKNLIVSAWWLMVRVMRKSNFEKRNLQQQQKACLQHLKNYSLNSSLLLFFSPPFPEKSRTFSMYWWVQPCSHLDSANPKLRKTKKSLLSILFLFLDHHPQIFFSCLSLIIFLSVSLFSFINLLYIVFWLKKESEEKKKKWSLWVHSFLFYSPTSHLNSKPSHFSTTYLSTYHVWGRRWMSLGYIFSSSLTSSSCFQLLNLPFSSREA